jgi:uridine kinase
LRVGTQGLRRARGRPKIARESARLGSRNRVIARPMNQVPAIPFTAGKRLADVEILARSSILAHLGVQELGVLLDSLDQIALPDATVIFREGDESDDMYFVLDGAARAHRGPVDLARLSQGDHFGELAILGVRRRAMTVETVGAVRLARISRSRFLSLSANHPRVALQLVEAIATSLSATLTRMTDDVGLLHRQRTLPRRATVRVAIGDRILDVATGSLAGTLLPVALAGAQVVAAAIDSKAVSLDEPVSSDARIEPITVAGWEGRRIYRASVGLLLLEAARRLDPQLRLRLGPRRADAQLVLADGPTPPREMIARVEQEMRTLVDAGVPLREELWSVDEARVRLQEQGWSDGASLLPFHRDKTIALVSCGATFALGTTPVVTNARALRGFSLRAHEDGILLQFGPALHGHTTTPTSFFTIHQEEARTGPPGVMSQELRHWLDAMNVDCVGRFDACCVGGKVGDLIRVSEGFHEKHIGRIADRIASDRRIRVVAIAGPSSSGKTTFINRLSVQLSVNGIVPIHLSLDDYYVDREKTPRDDHGEYDFEALEAIDLALFGDHARRLLAGERVRTPRFDFLAGKSVREGGRELAIGASNVLLVEGLHALSPRILASCGDRDRSFRVFVHPATALPFDRLTAVLPEDLRLVRRIVRDRHQRGYAASASIARWPSVRRGEERHVFTCLGQADAIFDSSLVYELAVLRVYAERYLLEIPVLDPTYLTAYRLRGMLDRFVPIHPDGVPPTSILREFIGGSSFDY